MSTSPDTDLDLNLHFLPDWAKQSPDANLYEKYAGTEGDTGPRRSHRDWKPDRRRRDPRAAASDSRQKAKGPRKGKSPRSGKPERKKHSPPPLPQVKITFVADEKGVDSLARQIKMTGRAFPLFEIGHMILQKPTRHSVVFQVVKKAEGSVARPLFVCALDDTLWLSEEEAAKHGLEHHFEAFYQVEKIPCDPPKGTYTFVAQCGISGVILGPPNHHDYQNQLQKLHRERFPNMPFEKLKLRVKIVRDEEVVKKWLEDQSFKTEYICLNQPEAAKLTAWEEVENHFREVHLPNIIKQVETHTLSGEAARKAPCAAIRRLVLHTLDEQRRFPLKVVHVLSQQFASRGLQFFKVNKTFTHVSVARPHYLDLENNPVSEGIRKIVEFIDAHPKCNRKHLIESLSTTPRPEPGNVEAQAEAASPPAAEPEPAGGPEPQSAQGAAEMPQPQPQAPDASAKPEEKSAEPNTPAKTEMPTPEQQAVISDLHWLIHQGHVIEFANGILETASKPAPAPQPKKQKGPKRDTERKAENKNEPTPRATAESGHRPSDENKNPPGEEKIKAPAENAEQKIEASSASSESASEAVPDSAPPPSTEDSMSPPANQPPKAESPAENVVQSEKSPENEVPADSISAPSKTSVTDGGIEASGKSTTRDADSASDSPPSEAAEEQPYSGKQDEAFADEQSEREELTYSKNVPPSPDSTPNSHEEESQSSKW